jgi:hypothetical protein
MRMFRTAAVLAFLLACVPAFAQQTAIHSVPIGKGAGNTGFNAAVPGASGQPLVSQGPSADPAFGPIANSGLTPGAANTAKGSLNGTAVVDLPLPSCTAVNQAWKYVSGTGINCSAVSSTTGYDMPINLGLSASISGGALTLTLTQANSSAPTSSNPVQFPFRSTTPTLGTVTWANVTATQSITIPNGATLGTASGIPFRIWIFEEYNGGTPELAVATCSNTTTVFPCAAWENTLVTSTTIGGSCGSPCDTAGALLASAGVAADAVRIIGFCEYGSGLPTFGTWSSSCTNLQVFGPGVAKPGSAVQSVYFNTAGSTTCTTSAYVITAVTQNITPSSTANLILANAAASTVSNTAGDATNITLTHGAGAAIGQPATVGTTGASVVTKGSASFQVLDAPGTVSSENYSIWCQGVGGNGSEGGGTITLQEIMG